MKKTDQLKTVMKVRKLQKELKKMLIETSAGDGAVKVEITAEQKIKKIHIDPERVDLEDIGLLERWLEDAIREALSKSQAIASEKLQPMMGSLGDLGL